MAIKRPRPTQAELKELLHYDPETGVFTWRKTRAGTPSGRGYRRISLGNRLILEHQLAWLYMTGEWPNHPIDHVNRDGCDNRWSNLRRATGTQNNANRRSHSQNTIGLKGVGKDHSRKNPYRAQITVNRRQIHLGQFKTPEEAHAAYCRAAKLHFGEFASDK